MRWIDRAPFDGQPAYPDGTKRCLWCGGRVPKGRRKWCSQRCVEEYLIRKSSTDARRLVFKRDRGVCAICGLDCHRLELDLRALRRGHDGYTRYRKRMRELNVPYHRRTFWDADHVVPVVEGGGACGLDNYRTLCLWCHLKEKFALAARRAKSRNQI